MTDGWQQDGEVTPAAWQRAAQAFAAAVGSGRLDLPLPGSGSTWERLAAFAGLAGEDLSLARLGEGHADAVAILAELGGPRPRPDSRWGVWAANPPGPNVTASRPGGAWVLRGTKQYCSGARVWSASETNNTPGISTGARRAGRRRLSQAFVIGARRVHWCDSCNW